MPKRRFNIVKIEIWFQIVQIYFFGKHFDFAISIKKIWCWLFWDGPIWPNKTCLQRFYRCLTANIKCLLLEKCCRRDYNLCFIWIFRYIKGCCWIKTVLFRKVPSSMPFLWYTTYMSEENKSTWRKNLFRELGKYSLNTY